MALYYLGEKVRNRVLSQSLSNQHISRAAECWRSRDNCGMILVLRTSM